jgi:hypothetical protein
VLQAGHTHNLARQHLKAALLAIAWTGPALAQQDDTASVLGRLRAEQHQAPTTPPPSADRVSVLDGTFEGSYGKPTTPDASNVTLSGFVLRTKDAENNSGIRFVVQISNNSKARWYASACIRLYDKDGLEIYSTTGSDVNIGIGQSDTSNGDSNYMSQELWAQVETIKVYAAAEFGCAVPPGKAISPVLTLNRQRPG